MLIVPLNLPSLPAPPLPPQTASSRPSSTGNTRRDGPNDRLDNSHLSPKLHRIQRRASGGAPTGGGRPILPNAGVVASRRRLRAQQKWSGASIARDVENRRGGQTRRGCLWVAG